MLHTTKGIILHKIKYRETSLIVRIFTEELGLQSYIVNNVRTKDAYPTSALYQSFNLVDLVVYYREQKGLNRIKEIKIISPFYTIHSDFRKSTILIFLNEIINKIIKEQLKDKNLFDFLFQSIITLEKKEEGVENFHLQFLIFLTRYLGFSPPSINDLFDQLLEKKMIDTEKNENILTELMNHDYSYSIALTATQRSIILNILMDYYQLHIANFYPIRSLNVLKEIMR